MGDADGDTIQGHSQLARLYSVKLSATSQALLGVIAGPLVLSDVEGDAMSGVARLYLVSCE
jgi:hypothetical protein